MEVPSQALVSSSTKWKVFQVTKQLNKMLSMEMMVLVAAHAVELYVVTPLHYYSSAAITMVTRFFVAPLSRLMVGLGAHWSVIKDKSNGYYITICSIMMGGYERP